MTRDTLAMYYNRGASAQEWYPFHAGWRHLKPRRMNGLAVCPARGSLRLWPGRFAQARLGREGVPAKYIKFSTKTSR